MSRRLAALAALGTLALAGCGAAHGAGAAGSGSSLTVLAAASLHEAFDAEAAAYRKVHPGTHITFSFAGSQELVVQVRNGIPADVLATADPESMAGARGHTDGPPSVFARNELAIAVAPGNPHHIRRLADLARRGLVVVLAAPQVPAGRYADVALRAAHVTVHPASLEVDVRSVLTKVELGEADAGVVYTTDVRSAHGKVAGVPVPNGPTATYELAPLRAGGRGFVQFVLSAQGRAILATFGFLPP